MDEIYPKAVKGSGIYLYDEDGNKYIDGSSGAVTASIGHGNKEIIHAMLEQAKKVSFVYRSQFTTEPAEELACKLNNLVDADEPYWSFLVNSGSEATETAMKMAIQHWQEQGFDKKNKILSRWISYHGITIGALSMSGHVYRRARFAPLLDECPAVSAPYCFRCPFNLNYPTCGLFCASELETAINRVGSERIAAFIAEPIVGAAGGVIVPPEGYYQKIKEICEKNNILFIADEVMTGMGRTGKMFAMEHWNVKPDLIVLGKGISSGYSPLAATLASKKVMDPILSGSKSVMSGHTFSANPQSAATALAVIHYIERMKLIDHSCKNGSYLIEKLKNMAKNNPIIGDVRGKGLMIGVEFVDPLTKEPFPTVEQMTTRVIKKAREKGLILYPANAGKDGLVGDAVIIAPPLIIKKKEMKQLLSIFEETLREIQLK